MELAGKIAIVIGASAGIGRAYAQALAGAGATVIAAARTLGEVDGSQNNTLSHTVKSGDRLAGSIHAHVCNALNEEEIVRLVDQTVANLGSIDVLVNTAAWMAVFDPIDIPKDDWETVMRLNVRAPYVAMSQAAKHMKRQRSGSIINTTARCGEFLSRGEKMYDGTILYGASKAALNRLTFFMAEELKPFGIAVNALSPGVVATDTALASTPNLRDYGGKEPTPEVLGPALLFLARQSAETLTGQILHTDQYGKSWPQQP